MMRVRQKGVGQVMQFWALSELNLDAEQYDDSSVSVW